MPKPIAVQSQVEQDEPTELETDLVSTEARVRRDIKHLDGKVVLLDYVFPFLKKLAKIQGDQEEQIEDAFEQIKQVAASTPDTGVIVELFEDIKEAFVIVGGNFDNAMVRAGFYIVTAEGMKPTSKCPPKQREEYEESAKVVAETITDILDAITELQQVDGADGAPDGGDGADGALDTSGAANLDEGDEGGEDEEAAKKIANEALVAAQTPAEPAKEGGTDAAT